MFSIVQSDKEDIHFNNQENAINHAKDIIKELSKEGHTFIEYDPNEKYFVYSVCTKTRYRILVKEVIPFDSELD